MYSNRTAASHCGHDFAPNYGKNRLRVALLNKFPALALLSPSALAYLRHPAGRRGFTVTASSHPPMLFVDMLFVMAVAISFIPILTGYCAHSRGRSFWLWFALGWLLPFASFFLLFALIARDELHPGRRLLGEARQILREAEEKSRVKLKS